MASLFQAALVTLGLVPSVGAAQMNAIEGKMTCKVQSNRVTSITDGKSNFFSGYKDKFQVGDTLIFQYTLNLGQQDTNNFSMDLKDEERNVTMNAASLYGDETLMRFEAHEDGNGGHWEGLNVAIKRDYIRLARFGSDLRFKRYYKSDWHGMSVGFDMLDADLQSHVFTLDCRHVTDKVDEIVDALLKAKNPLVDQ